MTRIARPDMDAIVARHPEIFQRSAWQRFRGPVFTGLFLLYLVFCGWFFHIGAVLSGANWGIAGAYLADWVSYESRPDIEIGKDGKLRVVFNRADPAGMNDPRPDWLVADFITQAKAAAEATADVMAAPQKKSTFSFMTQPQATEAAPAAPSLPAPPAPAETEQVATKVTVNFSASTSIETTPGRVLVKRGDESLAVLLDGSGETRLTDPLPAWAEQRAPGGKITVSLGLSGWADIEDDRVRIRNRFFGWPNFFFDTNSAFFGRSFGEVVSLITSGPELKPGTSNLSLALNDFLYNPSWQHLDVWIKLMQTIVMAFVGTVLATLIAFPLSFLAARNITGNRLTNQLIKRFFDFQRSVDMLIWALFFTRAFGPGPLAGMSAIFFTDTGTLGKLYAEALENVDQKQPEGVRSVGASPIAVNRYGVLPQVMPVFLSQALYFWESNTRSATILGAVGAGGIGLKLWEAMRTNSDWENVAYMVILILIVVFVFDHISNTLRSRLIGSTSSTIILPRPGAPASPKKAVSA
jgi:phosphonate transport system permease protein